MESDLPPQERWKVCAACRYPQVACRCHKFQRADGTCRRCGVDISPMFATHSVYSPLTQRYVSGYCEGCCRKLDRQLGEMYWDQQRRREEAFHDALAGQRRG